MHSLGDRYMFKGTDKNVTEGVVGKDKLNQLQVIYAIYDFDIKEYSLISSPRS